MVWLNKIEYNNKLFQVLMDEKQNRIILEIKNDSNYYYMYPEFSDLLDITRKYFVMDYIVYHKKISFNKKEIIKKIKKEFIATAQSVLICGVIISIALCLPTEVKSYALSTVQNVYNEAKEVIPNSISTVEELNDVFNAQSITKDDVHKAIDENENLIEFKHIIHEYVDDVYEARPEQNWWIFYQNIKRMNIFYVDNIKIFNATGTFNQLTSTIEILNTLDEKDLKITLRHELTHALSLIQIIIDGKLVDITFHNFISIYGRSTMEMLTSSFNSYSGGYNDYSYSIYKRIFDPLKIALGEKEFNNLLFEGNIDNFIENCKPYYNDISNYISYHDTLLFEKLNKFNIDEDFFKKLNSKTIEFYLNVQYNLLKNGSITYEYYVNNKVEYINNLLNDINDIITDYNLVPITISEQYKLLDEYEKQIFNLEMLSNIENASNNKYNLNFNFDFNEDKNSFDDIKISLINNEGLLTSWYDDLYNVDNINDFYIIVEISKYNNQYKLRLINKNNHEYNRIDLLTYQYINEDANIILEIPLADYINSIPQEILKQKSLWWGEYDAEFKNNIFNIQDIIEFANNYSENEISINKTK